MCRRKSGTTIRFSGVLPSGMKWPNSAMALNEGAGEHLAESTEATDEPATQFELRVAGHLLTLIVVVRTLWNQDPLRICENAINGEPVRSVLQTQRVRPR